MASSAIPIASSLRPLLAEHLRELRALRQDLSHLQRQVAQLRINEKGRIYRERIAAAEADD